MIYKKLLILSISVSQLLIPLKGYTAENSLNNESLLHHLYFFGGGGKGFFQGQGPTKDDNLTQLKYGIGYDFSLLSAEFSYLGLSNGDDLTIKGLNMSAHKDLLQWNNFTLSTNVGAYLYQSKIESSSYNSITPLFGLGSYYYFNPQVAIGLNYERIFNFEAKDASTKQLSRNNLDQISLSLVIKPWVNKNTHSTIATEVINVANTETLTHKEIVQRKKKQEIEKLIEVNHIYNVHQDNAFYSAYKLTESNKSLLNDIIDSINDIEKYTITITGSADSDKKHLAYNKKLAHRRAQSVMDYLLNHGIKQENIHLKTKIYLLKAREKSKPSERKVILAIKQESSSPLNQ